MRKVKGIISLLLIFFVNIVRSDVFYNLLNREDPCINLCEKTPLSFANNKYVKSCCQRGCRFFNLVDLHYGLESNSLNGTRDACEASCTEAYTAPQDRSACSTGLRKELLPGWWDSNGFKLPQTYIKTVPLDAGTVDYGIPSDYFRESDQSASIPGSDWLQCASKHIGLPHWLLASAIAAAALSAFWLCLYPEKSADPYREILIEKSDISPTFALYIPEAPLHKKPPPKYTESVDATESNMKV
nr:PREDICTED: uncharacterized protein LOC100877012 isoform X3 [Megachile rotundata]